MFVVIADNCSVEFHSVPSPVWSSDCHEGQFSRDLLPFLIFCGRPSTERSDKGNAHFRCRPYNCLRIGFGRDRNPCSFGRYGAYASLCAVTARMTAFRQAAMSALLAVSLFREGQVIRHALNTQCKFTKQSGKQSINQSINQSMRGTCINCWVGVQTRHQPCVVAVK